MMTIAWARGKSSVMVRSICATMPGGVISSSRRQRAVGELQGRLAAGRLTTPISVHEDLVAEPGAQRLGTGFLGGKALGIGRGPLAPAGRISSARPR